MGILQIRQKCAGRHLSLLLMCLTILKCMYLLYFNNYLFQVDERRNHLCMETR